MTYHVSAMERDARAERCAAGWACFYELSPANRYAWQQADMYFEALLEMLTPVDQSRNAPHVPPVGIPRAPASVHMEIANLQAEIARLTGGTVTGDRTMDRTAYDVSYSSAPRFGDARPPGRTGDMRMPSSAQYVPVSDSSPSPARIRRQAATMRHERTAAERRNRKGSK